MRDKFPRGCIEADPSLSRMLHPASPFISTETHCCADYYRTRGVAREKVSAGGERAVMAGGGLSAGASAVSKNERL